MPVTDIARESAVSVTAAATLTDVADRMREEAVGSVVVVDGDEPIGLVSDRDLAVAVLGRDIEPETIQVTQLLADDLVTIEASAGVYDAVEVMSERGVRRLVVVDDGDLAGIVSLSDVIVLLGMELQQVANTIRAVSPAYEQLATEVYD